MPASGPAPDGFADITLARLESMDVAQIDRLDYGVIGLDRDCLVDIYNATEARLAGLRSVTVIGVHFFLSTAQCMNNFMVAQRFEDEAELNCTIDFVLTFRMRPTAVRLRLLQDPSTVRRYILVQR